MKAILITISALFLLALPAQAQSKKNPKSTLKLGMGTAQLATGDYSGKHRFVEYDRSLFRFLSIGASGAWTNASQSDAFGLLQRTKAYQGDLNLYLAPIHNNINRFRIGGGGSLRYREFEFSDGESVNPLFTTETANTRGFNIVADYEVYLFKHIVLGARTSYHKYENQDRIFFFGLNGGIRF
ncbi:MAG: hypothetical protein AAGG75_13690 [Bacteroidota bacterium]